MPKNHNLIPLVGRRFGYLTVLKREGAIPRPHGKRSSSQPTWRCRCICGQEIVVRGDHLRAGRKKSCSLNGHFFARDINAVSTMERQSWNNMLQRCYNPKSNSYKYYGAKRVRVCRQWKNNFQQFLADMGPRPSAKHSLDRYPDPHGNYEPTNCRWATKRQQALNKRDTVKVLWKGEMMPLAEFAALIGVNARMISKRIERGWDIEHAMTTPSNARCKSSLRGKPEYPADWIDGTAFKEPVDKT